MTEREVVVAALAVAVAAGLAVAIPAWLVVTAVLVAAIVRRPSTTIVVLALAATGLAAQAEAGLYPVVGRVAGVATLVSDPQPRPGGVVMELRYRGSRYRSFVGSELTAAESLAAGEEVLVAGRIGSLDGPWEWRAARHLSGRMTIESLRRRSGGAWWWRSANWLHRTVEVGASSFDPEQRALFLGVVFGDDRRQSELERFRFRASGLAHLTAVSGQNVAFVLVAASPLLRSFGLRSRWVISALLLCWFAVVTRLEPSVLRAVAMAIVAATAAWWGRYVSGLRVVSVAVVGLLLVDPLLVWSLGFRLSVAASVAIVTLARPLARCIPGPQMVADVVAVSLAAQIGTAPLLLGLAGSVPALGPVANLVAVPVAGWLMVWGVVTGPVAGMLGEPVAPMIGVPTRAMVWWLSSVAAGFDSPGWPRLGLLGVVGSTVGVLAVLVLKSAAVSAQRKVLRFGLALVIVAGAVAVLIDGAGLGAERTVIGRGSTVWSDGEAALMVLDASADEGAALDALLRCRCSGLDVVVVTGGGRMSSAVVHSLRQVVDVGVVLATRPGDILNARRLEAGTVRVGAMRFLVASGAAGTTISRSGDGHPPHGRAGP